MCKRGFQSAFSFNPSSRFRLLGCNSIIYGARLSIYTPLLGLIYIQLRLTYIWAFFFARVLFCFIDIYVRTHQFFDKISSIKWLGFCFFYFLSTRQSNKNKTFSFENVCMSRPHASDRRRGRDQHIKHDRANSPMNMNKKIPCWN